MTDVEHLAARLTQLEAEVRTLHGALLALAEEQGRRLPRVPEEPAPTPPRTAAATPEATLRERRLALGLSQEALARAAGYSRSAVSAIEKGQRFSPDARLRLHEALSALEQRKGAPGRPRKAEPRDAEPRKAEPKTPTAA